jgi:hypothetical protein
MNMLKGYRTLIIAIGIAVVGAQQGLDWISLLPGNSQAAGWIVTGLGVAMMILRTITTTPVATKR